MTYEMSASTVRWLDDHSIESSEVIEALYDAARWCRPATADGIPVVAIWCRTRAGRPLITVLRRDPADRCMNHIVLARGMTVQEFDLFRTYRGV